MDRDIRLMCASKEIPDPTPAFRKLLNFLDRLEKANVWYQMDHVRDSVMVTLSIPGERWEVEFFEDEHIEIERFIGQGVAGDESDLERMLTEQAAE
ncbi:MAG: hypothetical protein LC745_13260 [Planctomycetia bacterium]|nr:hypothetical protein [Planctomycetia bacterium]